MAIMRMVLVITCVCWWGVWGLINGLTIPRALHAPTISLEEYGVVLKPGRIMSTADVTHVQQGFRIPIPRVNEEARTEVPVLMLCERYLKHGKPFTRVCSNVQKARDWLRATVKSLTLIQETVIRQALESLPENDDRQWVGVDKVFGGVGVGNEDSFSQKVGGHQDRSKREEPELRDVQYHIFGIAGAGDVDYNRQLIKILQESSSDMSKDMYELANRTEEAMNMISTVATHVAQMEEYMKKRHNWVVKLINYLEITDDAMQLFDFLMTMMLEDRMGAVVYLQDLVDQSYAFRKGIQSLLQGKLTIDLVPPALIKTAITEVTAYLKREHPRFTVAFESVAFYYDNSKPLFVREEEAVVVFVRIPIVSEEHLFRIYEILTFPVPIVVPGRYKKDALQITGLPQQVALSLSQRYYIPMHFMNWAGCYGETILMCKDIPYMKKVSDDTCMGALLRKDQGGVTRRCDLDYLLNPDFGEMAIYLDDGHVLIVSAETEGQLICGNKPPVKTRIENYAKLAIGCDCAFQTVGAWIPYSLRACQSKVGGAEVVYPDNSLLKARMHVKTWRQNITEGGEVTIEVTEDPFPPDLRNKFADMAKDFAVRVPMTDLMNRIKSHDANRRRKMAAVNRRWSFTKSPTGWPVFTGVSTFIIILVIGYLIYRCCKSVPQSPINMALGGLIPKGAAQEIERVAARVRDMDMTEGEYQECPTSGTEATTAAVLAIVLLLLILAIAVLIWKKRRAIMRTTVDGVYIQFSTPTHQEAVFLGEVTIPVDHLFLEGTVLLRDAMVNQMCLRCTLTLHWNAQLKGAANRPGMHPVTIPLPTTVGVSKQLAGLIIGSGKYTTTVRLLKYTSGLATPIPANLPRLVDSGWSMLGDETITRRNVSRMMRNERARRPEAPPRPASMEDLTTNRVGTGAVYEPLH